MEEPLSQLKQSLDQLLQADTSIKRKNSFILLSFGKEVYELLSFYFYDRFNPDGSENGLDIDGKEVFIKNAEELWSLIAKVKPNIFNGKG